jgi:phosphate starvation-inducible protein PhoH and related proteins
MAKRAQLNRQTRNNTDYDSRYAHDGRRGKEPRRKGKYRQNDLDHNVVDINAHSSQLATAYSPHRTKAPLSARTEAQQLYIDAIRNHNLTFGIGPAGTGKSYCAGALAAEALESGRIERIILTRPAVEAGENLGFLPGELEEKYAVYIDAFRDILNERLGAGVVDYCLRHGRIVGAPLAYMRGKTFSGNTFVILDEAQNTTPAQMKMFLTRIGENAKVVINGDIRQSDLRGPNGLEDAINKVKGLPGVHIHEFARNDIVRSGLVRRIMDRYEPE